MNTDTIAAIATPSGTGGISIIKISGAGAISAVAPFFRPRNPSRSLDHAATQTMIFGHIQNPNQDVDIDEVLVTVLKAPHSYTGEDVVEINCHGGLQVTAAILQLVLDCGLRLAEPGEFTRRAFLNGRIDLTQVEGTLDLINARTQRAVQLGIQMMSRRLADRIGLLRDDIVALRARIEAALDFCEEDGTDITAGAIATDLKRNVIPTLRDLVAGYEEGRLLRSGLRVVLTGKPNVGKSSLMNQLLRHERVIVTEIPGTTRDTIEEGLEINGLPVLLCDTAGIRKSDDPVERIGQQMAHETIVAADLILLMIDASRPLDQDDMELIEHLKGRRCILVRNKIDLVADVAQRSGENLLTTDGMVDICALHGQGLDFLKNRIMDFANRQTIGETEGCPPTLRQKLLLNKALDTLVPATEDADHGAGALELLALDLKEGERFLNQIIGIDVEAEVLDDIFKRFCVGK